MQELYKFKHENMEFSKDGSLDELIVLDRYAVPAYEGYEVGDTVVVMHDEAKQLKRVAQIEALDNEVAHVVDRLGENHIIPLELMHKPLETRPAQLWTRWAKGAASVEKTMVLQRTWENKFRKMIDGYGYSAGGRIQLMLGQEYVTGKRANLTAYNCFVARSPLSLTEPVEQFVDGLDVAYKEALIMRKGGGVGINISTFNTITGTDLKEQDFIFYLDKDHPDHKELMQRQKMGKLKGVKIVTTEEAFDSAIAGHKTRGVNLIKAVDSVEDGLFDNMKEMARNAYRGNAIAIDFNGLRRRNALVKGVNGRSSGAVSWMEMFILIANILQLKEIDCVDFAEIFSSIVHLIIQGGSRRGALMLILEVMSKLIKKFIKRKRQMGFLSGANISVGVDDTFMTRVKLAKEAVQYNGNVNVELSEELVEALSVWKEMIESAHASAEPGIVWLERYNKESNSWYFHPIICTNPCGEQGLPAWGVCNLGHHVLPRYYNADLKNVSISERKVSDEESELFYPKCHELASYREVDWDELADNVRTAVRFQDNIIDYTDYFMQENADTQLAERRIGIGSMGLGTLMIQLQLRYGSKKGNEFVDVLYKFIAYHTYNSSMDIAEEKGSFPAYEYDKFIQSGFMQRLLSEFPSLGEKLKHTGIRNVTSLTQAPTGSTGTAIDNIPLFIVLFGGTTTGVEPYFGFSYWRASRLGFFEQVAHIAKVYMEKHGLESIDDLPKWFVTAMELTPEDHVTVQAAVQKWTDSSISKTANCPKDYTVEQTDELYMLSYDLGLKGMTIYRDGSREAQVLATNKEDAKLESHIEADKLAEMEKEELDDDLFDNDEDYEDGQPDVIEILPPIKKRPEILYGLTQKIRVPFGDNRIVKAYITVNVDAETGNPFEVFVQSNTPEFEQLASVITRTTTQFLRYGQTEDNVAQIAKHLRKGQTIGTFASRLASLLEGIHYGKITMFPEPKQEKEKVVLAFESKAEKSSDTPARKRPKMIFQKCADCGQQAFDKANCICTACGSSKCN